MVGAAATPVEDAEETEPDTELQAALARARRLRQQELLDDTKIPKVRRTYSHPLSPLTH